MAETSVTLTGVRMVIDTGLVKMKQTPTARHKQGLEALLTQPVSKAMAEQRKGRAGREAPGHVYRLYTEATYQRLQAATVPEIQRVPLATTVLLLKACGVQDLLAFDFLDRPDISSRTSTPERP